MNLGVEVEDDWGVERVRSWRPGAGGELAVELGRWPGKPRRVIAEQNFEASRSIVYMDWSGGGEAKGRDRAPGKKVGRAYMRSFARSDSS